MMDQIYKDFSTIHADIERGIELMMEIDSKIDEAAQYADSDESCNLLKIEEFPRHCRDSAEEFKAIFDCEFGQGILKRAESAIAAEDEEATERGDEDEEAIIAPPKTTPLQKIKAIAADNGIDEDEVDRIEGLIVDLAKALGVITNQLAVWQVGIEDSLIELVKVAQGKEEYWRAEQERKEGGKTKFPTLTEEELTEMVDTHIKQTIGELAKALGVEEKVSRKNCFELIVRLKGIVQCQKLNKARRDRFLNQAFDKMQLVVIPLLRMALEAEYRTEEGDDNEDKNTLIEAAMEILEQSLRLTRGFEE